VVDDGHLKGMRYPHSTILFQTALVKKNCCISQLMACNQAKLV